jgi:hypothetical protein
MTAFQNPGYAQFPAVRQNPCRRRNCLSVNRLQADISANLKSAATKVDFSQQLFVF